MNRNTIHNSRPFGIELILPPASPGGFDSHLERRLSALHGQFTDKQAYKTLVASDPIVYEVYEVRRPEVPGELLHGLSIVHPGRVGSEYFMTKGHFHLVRETAEIYYSLKGNGVLLMESEQGEWAAETLTPGRIVYVPPGWAHRSINTDDGEDLVTFFAYPGNAGHDYGTIEQRGFRKLVVARGGVTFIDNPAWAGERRT